MLEVRRGNWAEIMEGRSPVRTAVTVRRRVLERWVGAWFGVKGLPVLLLVVKGEYNRILGEDWRRSRSRVGESEE